MGLVPSAKGPVWVPVKVHWKAIPSGPTIRRRRVPHPIAVGGRGQEGLDHILPGGIAAHLWNTNGGVVVDHIIRHVAGGFAGIVCIQAAMYWSTT